MTNAPSETGQMAVCCQNLTLGALRSRSALSLLVGALFKKLCPFFEQSSTVIVVFKAIKINVNQDMEFQ
jgi:hypothetical protein